MVEAVFFSAFPEYCILYFQSGSAAVFPAAGGYRLTRFMSNKVPLGCD